MPKPIPLLIYVGTFEIFFMIFMFRPNKLTSSLYTCAWFRTFSGSQSSFSWN